ncbi:hypothetical protein [Fodinibius halophilus]|uniref:Molecular chaperone n=1 Tax=Fodinibius halophilus TaxID=1736908 RepID=A0A6M1T762_9BACT|nr:hypothetical protein [Fodinibius halophilus]NGP87831.1 hypothetical protein [Fodinibius halophilus]
MNSFMQDVLQKKLIAFILLFCGLTFQSHAQVSIAPTSLYFSSQERFSSLTVSNGGQQAQEISISTKFGYPATVKKGVSIVNDSVLAEKKSMGEWVKIFPKNFTLQPQQRQTVRFVVRPPKNLSQGGYWTRVQIKSNAVSPPIESVEEDQIGAQINIVLNQGIPAYYFTSNAQTGINVDSIDFEYLDEQADTGQVLISMKQTGDAPFIGSIILKLVDQNGDAVYQNYSTNSVYSSLTRSYNIDLSDIEPGNYTISGRIISERRDVNQENLLQIEPVNFEKKIVIE